MFTLELQVTDGGKFVFRDVIAMLVKQLPVSGATTGEMHERIRILNRLDAEQGEHFDLLDLHEIELLLSSLKKVRWTVWFDGALALEEELEQLRDRALAEQAMQPEDGAV